MRIVGEKLSLFEEENQLHFRQYKNEGYSNRWFPIEKNLDVQKMANASKDWDADTPLPECLDMVIRL